MPNHLQDITEEEVKKARKMRELTFIFGKDEAEQLCQLPDDTLAAFLNDVLPKMAEDVDEVLEHVGLKEGVKL